MAKKMKKSIQSDSKTAFEEYLDIFRSELPLGESFDLLERKLIIGGRRASVFFVDGLHDSDKALELFKYLLAVPAEAMEGITSSREFLERNLPFMEAEVVKGTGAEGKAAGGGQLSAGTEGKTAGDTRAESMAAGGGQSLLQTESGLPAACGSPTDSTGRTAGGFSAQSSRAEKPPAASHPEPHSATQLHLRCLAQYTAVLPKLYTGLVPLIVEGLDDIIIMDARHYPARSVEEPEKEKTLRGAKDGFTETLMTNIGLIRRRIRSNELIFKAYNIGSVSKSDVALVYMKDRADMAFVNKLDKLLSEQSAEAKNSELNRPAEKAEAENASTAQSQTASSLPHSSLFALINRRRGTRKAADSFSSGTLTVSEQSLLEMLLREFNAGGGINPFPKVRYTQRPDVIAAHLSEGKTAIIVDNSPTVMLIPTSVFEFFQDVDDYYFPLLTGNYFRFIKMLNFIVILFLNPVFFLMAEYNFTPQVLKFFVPAEDFAIPIFWQFILLEISVDALKLASLNTPSSLGASLSVIGALILGEFSIESGWFIPQTILCMAVVALAAFTQPSIEFSYAMKFCRIALLIAAYFFGIYGLAAGTLLLFTVMATTKTLTGGSYLYPLIPFDAKILKRLIFRTQK